MKRIYHLNQQLGDLIGPQRGHKSPEEKTRAIHIASRDLFSYYNGHTGEYQKGLPQARVGYGLSTVVNDALHPFVRRASFNQTTLDNFDDGFMFRPANFGHFVAVEIPTATEPVRMLNEDQLVAYLNSPINAPTVEAPAVVRAAAGYQVYPPTVPEAYLRYLCMPTEPVYAYLLDNNGELELDDDGLPQYDDTTSVDTGWGQAQENALLWLAAKILSGENRDQYMQQFAEREAQKG